MRKLANKSKNTAKFHCILPFRLRASDASHIRRPCLLVSGS